MGRANSIKKNYNFVDYELMIEILGKKIQERRNEKGMTLNMLATYSKTDRNSIRRIEQAQNKNGATTLNLFRVAVALDISLQELFKEIDIYCKYGIKKYPDKHE